MALVVLDSTVLQRGFPTGNDLLDHHLDEVARVTTNLNGVVNTLLVDREASDNPNSLVPLLDPAQDRRAPNTANEFDAKTQVTQQDRNTALGVRNTSSVSFVPGEIVGFSSGVMAKADASLASFVRAVVICDNVCGPKALLRPIVSGLAWLKLESGVAPTPGDTAVLSTTAGRASNAIAALNYEQVLGTFLTQVEPASGRALVAVNIEFVPRRTV